MNKNVLKNFAINARLELLARVRDRATLYGITDEKVKNNQIVASDAFQKIDGQLLSKNEIAQRNALLQRIQNNGCVQVMEEAAYTWFNRFIAIKYMEVHKLLPLDQRVIPQQAGELPQIVREAQNVTLENIDFDTIAQYLDSNRTEELYKYLVIALSNQLSSCLPQMFEKISDYTELLFPDGLMKAESFLGMLANVDDENWQEIQVIGWLYQYYNTDLKNETFDLLKKNVKIAKDRIGAATQLFTPEWIVRYMVENSLGRLWYEGHPEDSLKMKWQYYLAEEKQEPEVETQLEKIRDERKKLKLEEIKLLDPCMGSGHILVYAFDVLMQIYRSVGYTDRDAVQSIIENNLYGLDIDDRAAQLAYFALMMKASEYDKRFLKRRLQPNVCSIQESNTLSEFTALHGQMSLDKVCINTANQLIEAFVDAKEYGSILTPNVENLSNVNQLMEQLQNAAVRDLEVSAWFEKAEGLLPRLAEQAVILQQKYDVVVTNPPYMGNGGMDSLLSDYVSKNYPEGKADLFAVFIQKCKELLLPTGYTGLMTSYTWMFLSGYEALRNDMLFNTSLVSLIQPEYHSFFDEAYVPICTFVLSKNKNYRTGTYIRLEQFYGASIQGPKALEAIQDEKCPYRFVFNADNLTVIPGSPLVYWANQIMFDQYKHYPMMQAVCPPKPGLSTGENERFLRYWHEVDINKTSFSGLNDKKWYPINKGGEYRRWYGNHDYIVNWENDGYEIKNFKNERGKLKSRPQNLQYNFQTTISWSLITTGAFNVRYYPSYFMQNAAGVCCYPETRLQKYILGLLNSKPAQLYASMLSPTLNTNAGDIARIPIIINEANESIINNLVESCIETCKEDWDSFETSWNFQIHPLIMARKEIAFGQFAEARIRDANKLERCFAEWETQCEIRFDNLKRNEEELNRIFIGIYGLQDELTPEVADKDVTIRKADLGRDVRSLISYAVGCMFGRYSLDVPGLVYAGGEWDPSKYVTYPADRDGILPITDDEYFQDDIVSMFVRWVKTVYGEDTLEENLQFIANALNPNGGTSREVIRSYFLNDFYSDHLKIYQKRPIYWQFDSGKQNGFKALMYLQRYDQNTVARLRTDYVHELQDRYRTQLEDARKTAESGDARQRSIANKRAQKLDKQLVELNKYEELVHHYADMRIPLDLDDGVKVNYAKLQDILTKIK